MIRSPDEDGFTLIEAIVSLVILSAAIIAALNIFTTSLTAIQKIEQRQAVMIAVEQAITRLKLSPSLKDTTLSGEAAGQRWSISVSPLFPTGVAPHMTIRPFRVTAKEEHGPGGRQEVIYDTVILALEEP